MLGPKLHVLELQCEYEVSLSSKWIQLSLIRSYLDYIYTFEECLRCKDQLPNAAQEAPTTMYGLMYSEHLQPRCLGSTLLQDDIKYILLTPLSINALSRDRYLLVKNSTAWGVFGENPLLLLVQGFSGVSIDALNESKWAKISHLYRSHIEFTDHY